nr:hypothetical protein [Escherichia coli]
TFSGKDWSLTARAGLHYEFDLTDSADVHLKDAAGEHQINGRKDSRMVSVQPEPSGQNLMN